MKVIYSPTAIRDLERIISYYTRVAEPRIAAAVGQRIQQVVARVARNPSSARRIRRRPDVRVALLLRYPYKIFYQTSGEAIEILHIRHTSRRTWGGEDQSA